MGEQIIWNRVELEKRRPIVRNALPPCFFVRKRVLRVEHFISRQLRTIKKVVQGRGLDTFILGALLEQRNIESECIYTHIDMSWLTLGHRFQLCKFDSANRHRRLGPRLLGGNCSCSIGRRSSRDGDARPAHAMTKAQSWICQSGAEKKVN